MNANADTMFKLLIVDIQKSYQDWEDMHSVLKKAGLDEKYLKIAKKIFDKERKKK